MVDPGWGKKWADFKYIHHRQVEVGVIKSTTTKRYSFLGTATLHLGRASGELASNSGLPGCQILSEVIRG